MTNHPNRAMRVKVHGPARASYAGSRDGENFCLVRSSVEPVYIGSTPVTDDLAGALRAIRAAEEAIIYTSPGYVGVRLRGRQTPGWNISVWQPSTEAIEQMMAAGAELYPGWAKYGVPAASVAEACLDL